MGGESGAEKTKDYKRVDLGTPDKPPSTYDPQAGYAASLEAADRRGGLMPGERLIALPKGMKPPPGPGWVKEGEITPKGQKQAYNVYVSPPPTADGEAPEGKSEPSAAGAKAVQDIEGEFGEDVSPGGICVVCIVRGFARGFAIGLAIALLLSMLSGGWLVAAAAVLLAVGIKGIVDLARNWDKMSSQEKQEAVAEIIGGIAGGRFGARGLPRTRGPKGKATAKHGSAADGHVRGHGHVADGQPQAVDPKASKIASKKAGKPVTKYKSKFAKGEGGQDFTDEVMNDPNTKVSTDPKTGRKVYKNDDLGRTTGRGQNGEPVRGGTVVVEGHSPPQGSSTPPGEVVSQYPSGRPTIAPGQGAAAGAAGTAGTSTQKGTENE